MYEARLSASSHQDLDRILRDIDPDRIGRDVYELLDDLRKRGEHYIRLYAPMHSGEIMRRIASDRPGPDPSVPGASEAHAGVRNGGSRHPLYVHGGTGIYRSGVMGGGSPLPLPGGELIRARDPRKPMRIQKRGEPPRYRMYARGQRANPFVLYAFQQLVPYARGKARRLLSRPGGESI